MTAGPSFAEVTARASSEADGEFFLADGGVYSRAAWGRLGIPTPPIPAPRDKLDPNDMKDVFAMRRTTWFDSNRPYLPLLPRFDLLTRMHPAFRGLCHKYGHFPVAGVAAGVYKLEPEMVKNWDTLEKWLRNMVLRLMKIADPDGFVVTKHFTLWPFPASYGYLGFVGTEGKAQRVAASARDAFYPLIAACSLFIRCCEERHAANYSFDWKTHLPPKPEQTKPGQERRPYQPGEIHAAWIHELVNSFAGDWEVERIGAIFRASDSTVTRFLELFGRLNMPIILYWGPLSSISPCRSVSDPKVPVIDQLHSLGPKRDVLRILELQLQRHDDENTPPPTSSQNRLDSTSVEERIRSIPLDSRSGQLPGEEIHAFLTRREAEDEKKALTDDKIQRQRIVSREAAAAQPRCPGNHGPKVWYWQKEFFGDGPRDFFRVRTLLEEGEVSGEWFDHNNTMKVFNGRANCWDICSELGDGPPLDDYDLDDDILDTDSPADLGPSDAKMEGLAVEQTHESVGTARIEASYITMELETYESVGNVGTEVSQLELEEGELEDHVREYLPHSNGTITNHASANTLDAPPISAEEVSKQLFTTDEGPETLEFVSAFSMDDTASSRYGFTYYACDDDPVSIKKELSWAHCAEALGNGRWLDSYPHLLEERLPPGTVERLRAFFSRLLVAETKLNPAFDLFFPDSQICLAGYRRFRVIPRRIGYGQDVMYQLVGEKGFHLLIPDPVTVLQTFRLNWGPTLIDVARQLARNGVRFYSLVPGPPAPTNNRRQLREEPRLGFRHKWYLPDVDDYRAYVSARNRFLQSPRGRAALFEGGHLARIAREVVDVESVVYGPDVSTVFSEGRCFFEDSGLGYWGEVLTEEESDLICGLYYCPTNKAQDWGNPAYLNTHRSWYPRLGAFRSSSINVDYWSKDCERWYQHRRAECDQGVADVKDASNWKRGMKLNHSVAKMTKANQTIAHEFLQKHYPFQS
ncbi:hypothetical protein V5O48_015144 [Marasmius crinis-equi]|uniref:Uncharacterized protein n=1 Tax=Marasmius crinis-equi TaxID=585013 RepID=A0ABR3EVB8_9AGAR